MSICSSKNSFSCFADLDTLFKRGPPSTATPKSNHGTAVWTAFSTSADEVFSCSAPSRENAILSPLPPVQSQLKSSLPIHCPPTGDPLLIMALIRLHFLSNLLPVQSHSKTCPPLHSPLAGVLNLKPSSLQLVS